LSQDSLEAGLAVADSEVRLRAAAALLNLGNLRGLPLVEAALLSPTRPRSDIANTLRGAVMLGTKDVAAVPAFARLVAATDVETRRAASFALSRIASPAAAAALISRFKDPDFEVRYNAVRGVALGLGEKGDIPSEEEFRINETGYLAPLRLRATELEAR
jgi:HEAT repeat protein